MRVQESSNQGSATENSKKPKKSDTKISSTPEEKSFVNRKSIVKKILRHPGTQIAGHMWCCGRFLTKKQSALGSGKAQDQANKQPRKAQHDWSNSKSGKAQEKSFFSGLDAEHLQHGFPAGLDTTLDWSLIKPMSDRHMINLVPDFDIGISLSGNQYKPSEETVEYWSMDNVKAGELIIKKGRTTGITVGRLVAARTIVIPNPRTKHFAWDIEPLSSNKSFCLPGGLRSMGNRYGG